MFWFCCQLGVPLRGVWHDMDKLKPSTWRAYRNKWGQKELLNAPMTEYERALFFFKSESHKRNQPHHWECYIIFGNAYRMPINYILEMVADWHSAGLVSGLHNNPKDYYEKEKDKMKLHSVTRLALEQILESYV